MPPPALRLWPSLMAALLAANVGPPARAKEKDLAVRGLVRDAASRAPVAGATVTASGGQSRADETTDGRGFFRLLLPGLAPGDVFRLRVEKAGYAVYDMQVAASEQIDLEIPMVAQAPPPRPRSPEPRPDPQASVVSRLLAELSSPSENTRLAAVIGLGKRAETDKAARDGVVRALSDKSYAVKEAALRLIADEHLGSREAVTAVSALLDDASGGIPWRAAETLGRLGPAAKAAIPELVRALRNADPNRNQLFAGDTWAYLPELVAASVEALARLGPAGRKALAGIAMGLDREHVLLAQRWIEVEHKAPPELLHVIARAQLIQRLASELGAAGSDETSTVFTPHFSTRWCPAVKALRAATAIVLLTTERGQKWRLDEPASDKEPATPSEPFSSAWRIFRAALLGTEGCRAVYAWEYLPDLPIELARSTVPELLGILAACPAVEPSGDLDGSWHVVCEDQRGSRAWISDTAMANELAKLTDATTRDLLKPLTSHENRRVRALACAAVDRLEGRAARP